MDIKDKQLQWSDTLSRTRSVRLSSDNGDAVEKLARFENFYNHLIERRTAIPEEIETLRKAGKDKTVTFKELLTEKMVNQMILNQLEKYGLR